MRINIEVPLSSELAPSSHLASSAPPPLIRLAPSGELVLIELQGSLEIDDPHPDGGQALARLEFHKGREDQPTLLISHHRLEGKIVALTKPFAVLEKRKRRETEIGRAHTNEDGRDTDLASSPLQYFRAKKSTDNDQMKQGGRDNDAEGIELLNDDDDDDDDNEAPGSPSMARKRARKDDGDILSQTPQKALKKRMPSDTSSSPMPTAPMRGSELDFSSPLPASKQLPSAEEDFENDQDWNDKKDTSTYFKVVCIIRKKILFTKRPEPIVRLDGEGGQQAKVALGLDAS